MEISPLARQAAMMELIACQWSAPDLALAPVAVRADRRTLAKTRWRARADDGREFGFELARPLRHGATIFQTATARYQLEQEPEPLLRVDVLDPTAAARIGWLIGNLHFPAQIGAGAIFVEADSAVRAMFAREHVAFDEAQGVFEPLAAGGGHHHHHELDHHQPSHSHA